MSPSNSENRIFLGNLDYDATEDDIRDAFNGFNIKIGEIRIPKKDDGRGKGFAFVDISPDEALSRDEVISEITDALIRDRPCRASVAFDRQGHGKRARKRDSDEGGGRSPKRDDRRGGRRGSSEYGW